MAIAAELFLPGALLFKRRDLASLARKDILVVVLGGFCLALHFGAWITSLKYIPIATSLVLVNSHPLFVVIASRLFLGERVRRSSLIGTAIGLAGMAVISRDAFSSFRVTGKGDGLALLAALAVVGYFIVGRKTRARIGLLRYVAPLYAVSAILLILVLMVGDPIASYKSSTWAYLGALALVPQIIGHTLFNWAIKHVRPTAISLTFLGEPVAASVLAFLFFEQRPPLATFIGGTLVLAGVYLANVVK